MINNVSFWWSTNQCFYKSLCDVYMIFSPLLLGNRSGGGNVTVDLQPLLPRALIQQWAIVLMWIYLHKTGSWQNWQKLDFFENCWYFKTSLFFLFEDDYKLLNFSVKHFSLMERGVWDTSVHSHFQIKCISWFETDENLQYFLKAYRATTSLLKG